MTNNVANASEYLASVLAAIDTRAVKENDKNSDNLSMQKTLKNIRTSVNNDSIAKVMFASNVDANLILKSERVNAMFSVYAYEKVIDLARCIASSVNKLDHRVDAIFRTLVKIDNAEMLMTHEDAQFALLKLEKHTDKNKRALIVTTNNLQSKSTANSQSSQVINVLQNYDVISETRDSNNRIAYKFNKDSANSIALLANIAAH